MTPPPPARRKALFHLVNANRLPCPPYGVDRDRNGRSSQARKRERWQSSTANDASWPLEAWPDVPTKFVLCTEDRLFPPALLRRIVAERLHIVPDEIAAGHCVALSRPRELADMLDAYAAGS